MLKSNVASYRKKTEELTEINEKLIKELEQLKNAKNQEFHLVKDDLKQCEISKYFKEAPETKSSTNKDSNRKREYTKIGTLSEKMRQEMF